MCNESDTKEVDHGVVLCWNNTNALRYWEIANVGYEYLKLYMRGVEG